MAGIILPEQASAPGTPAAGQSVIYPKTDGKWYYKDDAGVEHPFEGTGIEATILDAKGDLIAASADNTPIRLPVGANNRSLVADSAESSGLKWKLLARPVIAACRNLIARTNAVTPLSQVDVDADEIVLKDTSNDAYTALAVNLTAAITSSGANGLDTGSEAGNTWYYTWVIYNPTTDTVASLLSTSATAPIMPSGYTYKALVSSVRNNGSSNFIPYIQKGMWSWFDEDTDSTLKVLTSGTATSFTAVSCAGFCPPIATWVKLFSIFDGLGDIAGRNWPCYVRPTGMGDAVGTQILYPYVTTSNQQVRPVNIFDILLGTSQQVDYRLGNNTGLSSLGLQLAVLGFKLPGGGE